MSRTAGQKTVLFQIGIVLITLVLVAPGWGLIHKLAEYRTDRARAALVAEAWPELVAAATRTESTSGPIVAIEVLDYQCPYCRASRTAVDSFLSVHPEVSIGYLHYPLSEVHLNSTDAARFALCAAEQHSFEHAHEYLLTATEWAVRGVDVSLADAAQIRSTVALEECMAGTTPDAILDQHRVLAQRLGIRGTPALITPRDVHHGAFTIDNLVDLVGH